MYNSFVFITLALIFGIISSYYLKFELLVVFLIMIFLALIFIFNIIRGNNNGIVILTLFFLLGVTMVNINSRSDLINIVGRRAEISGVVDLVISQGEKEGKYRVIIHSFDDMPIVKEKTILKVYGEQDIQLGDKITFYGELKKTMRNTNPKLFNYKLYLMTEGIYTTININDYSISNVDKSNKEFKYIVKYRFSSDIKNLFDSYLEPENSSLVTSIILGESSYMDEDNVALFRDMGLAHILAVSGLHVGIISGFLIWIFARLGIKRRTNTIITLSIVWIYGFLIGFPPSIIRSSIMFTLLFYSQLVHEPYESINSIFLAMFIILIINPLWIFSLGFQLSFIATISIVLFTNKITGLFYPLKNKIIYTISSLLGVQLGLFPIQSYYFNRISILGLIVNLIIVPILSLGLVIGVLMIPLNYIFPMLNYILGWLLNLLLNIQFYILELLSYIPLNIIKVFSPDIAIIFVYYFILLLLFNSASIANLKKPVVKTVVIYSMVVILFLGFNITTDKSMEVHFIDVGQGDAILIRAKGKDYLMDTGGSIFGSFDPGESITLPYLEKLGIRKLEAVFITHFHEDHCKGILALLNNINIKKVYASYAPEDNLIFKEIIAHDIPINILEQGDEVGLDKSSRMIILWPPKDLNIKYSENNMSLTSMLLSHNNKVLLTGDIEREAEEAIANSINPSVDIIKVPHHGSKTSSTQLFLDKLKPEIGIITVGRNNLYGHPNKIVLENYDDINTEIYRTDEMGLIKLKLSEKGREITRFLKDECNESIGAIEYINNNLFVLSFYLLYYILAYVLIKLYISRERIGSIEL